MRSALITFVTLSLMLCFGNQVEAQTNSSSWALKTLDSIDVGDKSKSDSLIALCDSIVTLFSDLKLPCNEVKAYLKKSELYTNTMRFEDASQSLVEAREVFDKHSCDEQLLAEIYLRQSSIYVKLKDYEKCDSLCDEVINMFQPEWSNKIVLISAYLNRHFDQTDLKVVMPNLDSAYALAVRHKADEETLQKILINKGTLYAMNDSVELAQQQLMKALAIAKRRNELSDVGLIYNNLAGLSSDPDQVLIYIDSAIYYAELNHNLANLQTFLQNRAFAYTWQDDYEKAYKDLWRSFIFQDSLYNKEKYKAIAEVEEKYESEKKENEIKSLHLEKLNSEVEKLKYKRNQYVLFAGATILGVIALFFAYSFVAIRKNRNILADKNQEISKAVKRSDELLLNILPPEVADELKQTGKSEAKYYKQVSILFTDLVDFTQSAEFLTTAELVEELNFCFKGFDEITEKYGIEKIKTIGDAYMIAGGIPVPSEDSVKKTILAALDMQEFISKRKKQLAAAGKIGFEMRAGVHTGPVVAGIVGVKKFQYDLWGDTVNTASRMETAGSAGKVNISETTYNLIKQDPAFVFENRGMIEAKGKGKLEMYYVSRSV